MVDMAKKDILPAVSGYSKQLAETVLDLQELGIGESYEADTLKDLVALNKKAGEKTAELEKAIAGADESADVLDMAIYYRR